MIVNAFAVRLLVAEGEWHSAHEPEAQDDESLHHHQGHPAQGRQQRHLPREKHQGHQDDDEQDFIFPGSSHLRGREDVGGCYSKEAGQTGTEEDAGVGQGRVHLSFSLKRITEEKLITVTKETFYNVFKSLDRVSNLSKLHLQFPSAKKSFGQRALQVA